MSKRKVRVSFKLGKEQWRGDGNKLSKKERIQVYQEER